MDALFTAGSRLDQRYSITNSGQLERGEGGFLHWQIVVYVAKRCRTGTIRSIFGPIHAEPTRSNAAEEYVWKDETAVSNTRFELGTRAVRRNSKHDWDGIWELAKLGKLESVPSSIRIQSYSALRRIGADYAKPVAIERTCMVYWGRTGTGKSRSAWSEAGMEAYPKNPRY